VKKPSKLIMFIVSMLIFGTNGLLVSHISLSSAEIVMFRTLIGFIMLLAVVLITKSFSFSDLKADLMPATVSGAALGLGWLLLFSGYRMAGVSLATLTYYCGPILVIMLSPVLFKERLTWNKLSAIAIVAVGMVCITGSSAVGTSVTKGIICAGAAAVFYAALIIFGKRVKHLSGLNSALYELLIAFLTILIYLIVTGVRLPVIPAKNELVYIALIGIINTGLAYYLYFSSLQALPAQTVSIVCYVDPMTAVLVAAVFLNEAMSPLQWVGAVLILGGACLGEAAVKHQKDPD